MRLSFPSSDFDATVAAVCHGSATDEQAHALNELLRNNPKARDEYLFQVEIHTRLGSEPDLFAQYGADRAAEACIPTLAQGAGEERREEAPAEELESPVVDAYQPRFSQRGRSGWPENRPTSIRRRMTTPALALAACVVLTAMGVWVFRSKQSQGRTGSTSSAVAMLTRVVDARWGESKHPLRVGSALEPGRLRLESGLAQVVFYSGVRIVFEGPTELQLVSAGEAFCPTGRLLAEVPPPARGFRLRTAQLNVVDLGTAFGIDAAAGQTEVHVFQGKVQFAPATGPNQLLEEGRAAVVQGSAPPRLMAASEEAFGPMFEFQRLSLASEALRYDQWRVANAQLNREAALLVHFDFETFGDSDWTLRNSAEADRGVQWATIIGCQRAQGRWREKQALEFQSVNDRVRLAVPGQFQSLTLAAWVCVKGLDRQFNSLFMSDGFEPGTLHWLIRNDGVVGLTVFGPGVGNYQILVGPPVVTLDKFGTWLHLAVVLDGRSRELTHYVNGAPVSRLKLKSGPPFRVGSAELGNWNARSGPNPAPSLVRNLSGALDEFELFSRPLGASEVQKLYNEGKPESEP